METLDPVLLARIQFAFTVSFHIIFPAFTIGLASYLAVLEGLWLATRKDVFLVTFKFWLPIFAVAFAMGVVSGIVMSYQFGTNWGPFAEKTAPILGPLLAYEVLTAFFLEAGFLGVMLFGLNRVGPRLHFTATVLVAVGTRDAVAGSAAGLARLIPGAEALDIPNREHLPATGDKIFKACVLEFLAKRR